MSHNNKKDLTEKQLQDLELWEEINSHDPEDEELIPLDLFEDI